MRYIPQWVFDDYPWLKDVLIVLNMIREEWHKIEGLVILVGMGLVVWQLRRERLKLSERVDTLGQIVRAARDEAELAILPPTPPGSPPPPPPPRDTLASRLPEGSGALPTDAARADALRSERDGPGRHNWEAIRLGWRDVRDRLELAIEGIRHRAVRGKYSRIPRYAYRHVINALQKDGFLPATVADKLRSMDTAFNILKFRPATVTNAEVTEFNNWLHSVDEHLPPLPEQGPDE